MSGALFNKVKTVTDGETILAADWNAEFDNVLTNLYPAKIDDASSNDAAMQTVADPYPASAISLATSLAEELHRLRYLVKQITGESQWYIDPDNNIATMDTALTTAGTDIDNLESGATAIPYQTITAAPGSDLTYTGPRISLKAHQNVAFGDLCYINSDGEATLVDADAIGTVGAFAIAVATILADASGYFALPGALLRNDAWNWTVGGRIYASTTGTTTNTLTQTPPSGTDDAIQIVGVATHADRMFFYPQLLMYTHT